ncbi:hypothetical protein KQI36_07385 [Clostridium senegalense]|uniref:hypothetical protein n=1 Tax=Clostridium senegalense TaxID=1465809 RepID=UPI001C0F3E1C|nr:hypothetical protein [Clostridium senegalense]MBU5226474.1 hypothetical protein [Clostridium senegalense]
MKKNSTKVIWGMFIMFTIIFILNFKVTINISETERMFFILELWGMILAIILLIKNKLPQRKYINISLILSILVALSYSTILVIYINKAIFLMIKGFIITLISALAIFSTFEKHKNEKLLFLNTKSKGSILISILFGISVGVVLGIVNYLFMKTNNVPHLNINSSCFVVALSPAIYEEIVMRALFYAFSINLLEGKIQTKFQRFTCWFMMIMPHVIVHTPDSFIYGGITSRIISIIIYVLVFALPFAILQKKVDITSSMIAHGLVDTIRFCFFGLPF